MSHSSEAPQGDRDPVGEPHTEPVDDPADEQQGPRGGELERRAEMGELFVVPVKFELEGRLEQRQNLAIDVVERGGKEDQRDEQRLRARDADPFGCRCLRSLCFLHYPASPRISELRP